MRGPPAPKKPAPRPTEQGRRATPEGLPMSDKIKADARYIRKLIREAESVTDEAMIACARLRQAMVHARQNPEVPIDAGQKALLRLSQAEQHALSLSTGLLRVHDELNRVNVVVAGDEEKTDLAPMATLEEAPASIDA